jgi:cytochrome c553
LEPGASALRLIALVVIAMFAIDAVAADPKPTPEQITFFENKIRPIFAEHCLKCHSAAANKTKGSLSLDHREDMLRGGESGPVLKPGSVKESPLIAAVEWSGDLQMPPEKKLSDEQIAALKAWVSMGAPDPRERTATAWRPNADHWSVKPITEAPTPPSVKDKQWGKNAIDQFVLAALEAKNMQPAATPEMGKPDDVRRQKEAVLRRAYFDLIGLPPSPQQIRAFVADSSPKAFEKVIDELLQSPHYGERWARHWMDTARYSDTGGVPERGDRRPRSW